MTTSRLNEDGIPDNLRRQSKAKYVQVKPVNCAYCLHPYLTPCNGNDPECPNRVWLEQQAKISRNRKRRRK